MQALSKIEEAIIIYKLGKSNYIHLTIDEGEIFIGCNNQQNEYLTHRFAKTNRYLVPYTRYSRFPSHIKT